MVDIFDLSKKTVLITGGSSGLGVQFARALAYQGADIALLARREEKLQEVASEIEAMGHICLPIKCDVTKEDDVEQAVAKTFDHFGKIDVLINNAGVSSGTLAEDLSIDEWNKVINTNLTGVWLASKHVIRYMKEKNNGRIINIASMWGAVGNTAVPVAPYHASKGGVINLTRALAAEWAKYGITVNAVGPGFFESEMTDDVLNNEQFLNYIKLSTPLGRIGRIGELNGIIIYLSSDASSYTTGQTIFVDGGTTSV